jgi:hypothetical protein
VSFSVSVHRTPDETLFFAPVAGDEDLHQFWSVPASQLDLPLLTQIYDEGLQVSGADLGRLHDEVWTLEKRWTEIISDDEIRTYDILGRTVAVPLLAHLSHRAESVLAAVELAQKIDGVLTIS